MGAGSKFMFRFPPLLSPVDGANYNSYAAVDPTTAPELEDKGFPLRLTVWTIVNSILFM